jgi:hypothetical protein
MRAAHYTLLVAITLAAGLAASVIPSHRLKVISDAQDSCGCNAVLIRDTVAYSKDEKTRYAFLRSIDSATFTELKKTRGGNATIPVGDFLIGLSGSYEDFDTARNHYLENANYSDSQDTAETYLTANLSKEVVEAWKKCKLACFSQNGISCWVEDADSDTVVVRFAWRPEPAAPGVDQQGHVTSYTVDGGVAVNSADDEKYKSKEQIFAVNGQDTIFYRRLPGKVFRLKIGVNGNTASVSEDFPKPPPAKIYKMSATFITTQPYTQISVVQDTGKFEGASSQPTAAPRREAFTDDGLHTELFNADGTAVPERKITVNIIASHPTVKLLITTGIHGDADGGPITMLDEFGRKYTLTSRQLIEVPMTPPGV